MRYIVYIIDLACFGINENRESFWLKYNNSGGKP
jgi:hypothetical protein